MSTYEKDVNMFVCFLQTEKNYSPHTILNYKNDIEHFITFMKQHGTADLAAVSYALVRIYLSELHAKKFSRKTVARKLSSLRSLYKFLLIEKLVKENPFSLASTPKQEMRLPSFVYKDELVQLFSVSDQSTALGQRNQAILELLYATGIRVSECCDLTLADLDFQIGTVAVMGKGRKERYVPLGSYAIDAMQMYIQDGREQLLKQNKLSKSDKIFLNFRGGNLTTRGVRKIFDQIVERAALTIQFSPHVLRHTFATHLLNEGADMRSVQELLGHAHLSSTQIYTQVTKEHLKHIYDNFHPRA